MKKSFAYPIVFMAIITAIFVLVLAFLNDTTADIIEFNEDIELQKKILYVFDIDYDENNVDEINNIFNEYITEEKLSDGKYLYTAKKDGEIIGYAFPATGPGLWGSIEAYVGISEDKTKLLGLDFISQEETPGLGGRIDEKEYKEQFRGIDLTESSESKYIISTPAAGGNVDAIAGATLTSEAVVDLLNADIKKYFEGGIK